jgi:hypothetical protein
LLKKQQTFWTMLRRLGEGLRMVVWLLANFLREEQVNAKIHLLKPRFLILECVQGTGRGGVGVVQADSTLITECHATPHISTNWRMRFIVLVFCSSQLLTSVVSFWPLISQFQHTRAFSWPPEARMHLCKRNSFHLFCFFNIM